MDLSRTRAYATYKFIKTIYVPTATGKIEKQQYSAKWFSCYGEVLWATDIYLTGKERVSTGVPVDMRSLEATQAGCCPPALEEGFIGGESEGEKAFFAAEEALKLHKRGYFGGGG